MRVEGDVKKLEGAARRKFSGEEGQWYGVSKQAYRFYKGQGVGDLKDPELSDRKMPFVSEANPDQQEIHRANYSLLCNRKRNGEQKEKCTYHFRMLRGSVNERFGCL
jgi:hypothetical protein